MDMIEEENDQTIVCDERVMSVRSGLLVGRKTERGNVKHCVWDGTGPGGCRQGPQTQQRPKHSCPGLPCPNLTETSQYTRLT